MSTMKGTQLVIDAAMLDDPRAKNYTPQQLTDLSFCRDETGVLE